MQNKTMKSVNSDILNLAIRKDLLFHMSVSDTSLDFCEWCAHTLCSNRKTIATKFRDGYWTTHEIEKIILLTGGVNIKEAFKIKSQI